MPMPLNEPRGKEHESINDKTTGLLSMPPELMLKILDGFCIKDIVNVAQTCFLLRSLVISNKACIIGAYDRYTLDLPVGCPIGDLSGEFLYTRACRSNATSVRLSQNQPLVPIREESFEFASLNPEWHPQDHLFEHFFQRGDLFAFHNKTSIVILKLGPLGVLENYVALELESDRVDPVDYQLLQEERLLLIAYMYRTDNQEYSLHVKGVCLSESKFGQMTSHFRTSILLLRPGALQFLTIRDPYLIVNHGLIIDWRLQAGLELEILAPGEAIKKDTGQWEHGFQSIIRTMFHPHDPVLIVFFLSYGPTKSIHIRLLDIPTDMPSVGHEGVIELSLWDSSHQTVECRDIPNTNLLIESPLILAVLSVGLRILPDKSWLMDTIVHTDLYSSETYGWDHGKIAQNLWTSRLSINLSDWTSDAVTLESRMLYSYNSILNRSLRGMDEPQMDQIHGTPYFVVEGAEYYEFFAPKFDNGDGKEACWVHWVLPTPGFGPQSNREPYSVSVLSLLEKAIGVFNVHTGKVYICCRKGIGIVHL